MSSEQGQGKNKQMFVVNDYYKNARHVKALESIAINLNKQKIPI